MKLSVIIAAYNEKATIAQVIYAVRSAPGPAKEILVVDDGSTDGTRELLEGELSSEINRLFVHDRNCGKGASIRTAAAHATGEIVIIQDADLEYDPKEYPLLIQPIAEGKADVVYGSRFVGHGPHRVLYYWHWVGNWILTTMSNMLTNVNLTDMETCYKAFRREVLQSIQIEEDRFGFEPEITAKVAKGGWRLYEVGVSYSGRTYEQGKKINWKDGLHAVWCIVKYNLI